MAGADRHAFIESRALPRICQTCGRECNDYDYHFPTYGSVMGDKDLADKVQFASGATSGTISPPAFFKTEEGEEAVDARFAYGNLKHENETNVLVDANWLKAFHGRDLKFFRARAANAKKHINREMSGRYDKTPGGNCGAVGWWANVMPFVARWDPPFYAAITGVAPHPGAHENRHHCPCPRCEAALAYQASLTPTQGKPNDPA